MSELEVQSVQIEEQNVAEGSPKKVSKLEMKRQAIFQERVQRYVGDGMSFDDAVARIHREDYERLPPTEKISRLEGMVIGNINGLAQDITLLKQNQDVLAHAMDVNFRAFDRLLRKLGITEEDLKTAVGEAEKEILDEQAKNEGSPQG